MTSLSMMAPMSGPLLAWFGVLVIMGKSGPVPLGHRPRGCPGAAAPNAKISPFVLSAYNLNVPDGPPSLTDPLIRLHLGYGEEIHDDDVFGGVQFLVHPMLGGAVLNYQGQPGYMLTLIPMPGELPLEITAGTLQGDEFIRVGYVWNR